MSDEKTIGQLMRWKYRAREAEKQLAERDKTIEQLTGRLTQVEADYNELEAEVNGFLDDEEAGKGHADDREKKLGDSGGDERDAEIAALRSQLLRGKIESRFNEMNKGRLNDGVTFDHVLRNVPDMDISQLDENLLDDEFYDKFTQAARDSAPYLFRPSQEAVEEGLGKASQTVAAAKRQLPTFMQRGTGGGTPPPVESPTLTATRLRDPAEAIKRAAAAREQGSATGQQAG